ncbi:MAG: hypothetical protein Q8K79_01080 [Solirubrobacteraceae bacterium]|nr:hypothetical protein [Solirubrobacteraceae bacterium]
MDDPVPIEGIIEGEPEALAAVCAAGGSAVIAYCSAVGASAYVAETVVAALSTFRRAVVEHADQSPSQLEKLLVSATASAARQVAGVDPAPVQQAAAVVALEGAVTAPLTPGLAPRIIRALVEAAPVTALGGDAAAVRRSAEQHYIRMFDGQAAAAPAHRAAARPPAAPRPATAAGEAAWVPPELAGLDAETLNAQALTPAGQWNVPTEPPAPAAAPAAEPIELPAHATPPDAPSVAPPPHALVIKRGGHWPFKRRPRKAPRAGGGPAARTRNVVLAAVAGLAVGAGIVAVAMPEKEVEPDPTLVRPLDTPFTVDGAVFNVARTNQAMWALEIRRRPLREGRTWLTLAAQTRNIDRPNFLPRSLGYRLRTPSGIVIGPDTAQVPSDITADRGRLPAGQRSSVHLGFQVPRAQRGLALEFDPSPRGPRVRVPLN